MKQPSEMTDDELRIKVAELCGWERGPKVSSWIGVANSCWHRKSEQDGWQDNPPDYPQDLNACHEMEEHIPENKWFEWCGNMAKVCGVERESSDMTIGEIVHRTFSTNRATARQRAEAFVMTMSK